MYGLAVCLHVYYVYRGGVKRGGGGACRSGSLERICREHKDKEKTQYKEGKSVNTVREGLCISCEAENRRKESGDEMKKKKPIVLEELSPEELVKYEIAKELGLFDRVMTNGWGSLSAKETGRIGGILAKRRKVTQQAVEETEAM